MTGCMNRTPSLPSRCAVRWGAGQAHQGSALPPPPPKPRVHSPLETCAACSSVLPWKPGSLCHSQLGKSGSSSLLRESEWCPLGGRETTWPWAWALPGTPTHF